MIGRFNLSLIKSFFAKLLSGRRQKVPFPDASEGEISPDEARAVGGFQIKFGMRFTRPLLLATALKHRSYLNMTNEPRTLSNERLEFLGDAVLDLVVTAPADSNGTEVYGFGTGSPRWRHYAGQP